MSAGLPADRVASLGVSGCDRHAVEHTEPVGLVGLSVVTWRSDSSRRRRDVRSVFWVGRQEQVLLALPDDSESIPEFRGQNPVHQLQDRPNRCHAHLERLLKQRHTF